MGFPRLSLNLIFALAACTLLAPPLKISSAQESSTDSATLKVSGVTIDVTLPEGQMKLSRNELLGWVKTSASTVADYYGHFPVPHLTVKMRSTSGSGVRHGVTYPKDGGLIFISVGRDADVAATKEDWVLVHEMIHLAFPSMPDDQHWIEEGISTYVEPVARAREGSLDVKELWGTFVHDMPKGEPAAGDQGLDNTHTWGRTYWGGAIFCLLADVRIRERTKNRKGLEDALRGINHGGGNITEDWDIGKALTMGDKATGTAVLQDLYKEMRDKPDPIDLDQIWKKLGIAVNDGTVTFDDKAPEANIRKAITSPPKQLLAPGR
ncbi:MAG TPA: hypothetical protein VHV32_06550 [Candidatus Angelobacter sp.]|jgi:hypothetical protein|nr:hypothetical protein [Candidatus Angelobacter sp.]